MSLASDHVTKRNGGSGDENDHCGKIENSVLTSASGSFAMVLQSAV